MLVVMVALFSSIPHLFVGYQLCPVRYLKCNLFGKGSVFSLYVYTFQVEKEDVLREKEDQCTCMARTSMVAMVLLVLRYYDAVCKCLAF